MNDKLPPPTLLTAKQAKFVEGIARGMLAKDAYRMAFDTEAEDNAVRADAAKLRKKPAVALALRELLRNRRLADMDSIGELIADTKADQEAARQRGADAAVAAFARMRGNWLGIERQTLVLRPESLLSDAELIERLAGDDPARQAAAQVLLGVPDSFEDAIQIATLDAEDKERNSYNNKLDD
jgi:hypothetical protein